MKRLLTTATLAALLMGCTAPDEINESNLYGCWYFSMTSSSQSCMSFSDDHTYKLMMAADYIYMIGSNVDYPRDYYEGSWSLADNELILYCADTIARTLYGIEMTDGKLTFQLKNTKGETKQYKAIRGNDIRQSDIAGTWSFTERQVIPGAYDMVMSFDEECHARMTFSTPNNNHGHDILDWKDVDYRILGHYIIFTGLNPMHYFERITKQDGSIEYSSGNSKGTITRFRAIPQDPTAHTLRLDGFIF